MRKKKTKHHQDSKPKLKKNESSRKFKEEKKKPKEESSTTLLENSELYYNNISLVLKSIGKKNAERSQTPFGEKIKKEQTKAQEGRLSVAYNRENSKSNEELNRGILVLIKGFRIYYEQNFSSTKL